LLQEEQDARGSLDQQRPRMLSLRVEDGGHVFPVHERLLKGFAPPPPSSTTLDHGEAARAAGGPAAYDTKGGACGEPLSRDTSSAASACVAEARSGLVCYDASRADVAWPVACGVSWQEGDRRVQDLAALDPNPNQVVSFRGRVESTGWRHALPAAWPSRSSQAPLTAGQEHVPPPSGQQHVGGGDAADGSAGAPSPGAHGAHGAHGSSLHTLALRKEVLLVSFVADGADTDASVGWPAGGVHVYIDAKSAWMARGLLPGALVLCRRVVVETDTSGTAQRAAGAARPPRPAPRLVCRAFHETYMTILQTADDEVRSDREVQPASGRAAWPAPHAAPVRVGDLDAVDARGGMLTLEGSLTSIWKVALEMVCPACLSVAPATAAPLPPAISCSTTRRGGQCKQARAGGEAQGACTYSLMVKAEGRFEDGSGFCRVEMGGSEVVLDSLLRLSHAARRQLLAAAFQSGRLAFQGGVHHEEAVKHAQTCALLNARPLPASSAQNLCEAARVLSTAVHDALESGALTRARILCQQIRTVGDSRASIKKVLLHPVTTATRPTVSSVTAPPALAPQRSCPHPLPPPTGPDSGEAHGSQPPVQGIF